MPHWLQILIALIVGGSFGFVVAGLLCSAGLDDRIDKPP